MRNWHWSRPTLAQRLALATFVGLASTTLGAAPAAAGCDDDDRPPTPHSLKAVPLGSGGIMLQWSSNVGHYDIYISDEEGRPVREAPNIVGGATNENYHEFYGLDPDKKYVFSMRARTEGGTEGCVSKAASEPVSARTDTADTQDFCHRYTNDVMAQIKQMNDKQCRMSGNSYSGIWARSENAHFLACIEQKRARKSGLDTAQWARNQELQACKEQATKCKAYRGAAVAANITNRYLGCGYDEWNLSGSAYYSWCMGLSADSPLPGKKWKERSDALIACRARKKSEAQAAQTSGPQTSDATCPVPADWADMLAAHNELRKDYCGSDLTWNCDLARDAQAYAEECTCGHSNAPGVGENLAARSIFPDKFPAGPDREAFDSTWKCEKDLYDFNNPVIVGGNKTNCLPKSQGGDGVNGHFTQIVWKSNSQLGCGRARCPIKEFKDNKCVDKLNDKGEKQYQTVWVCRYRGFDDKGNSIGGNNDSLLTQNVQKPPACTTQKFHSQSVSCLRGMVPTDDGSCACPPGTQWDGRACAEPPRAQSPTRISPVQPPVTRPVCPVGLPVGTPPNCCPAQHHFDPAVNPPRGTCVADTGTSTAPTKRVDTQQSTSRPAPGCPAGTHFGRTLRHPRGACVVDTSGATTSNGANTQPNTPSPPPCPTGTHFERTLKNPGGACVVGGGGTNGNTQPNTTRPPPCPAGTHFARTPTHPGGACVSDTGGSKGTQPGNQTPNPKCPAGTHLTRSGQCETDAKPTTPTTKPAPTSTPTPSPKCTGGRLGTPPNCFCRAPSRFIGGRCRILSKPTPAPTGPTPHPTCPSGTKPPDCSPIVK